MADRQDITPFHEAALQPSTRQERQRRAEQELRTHVGTEVMATEKKPLLDDGKANALDTDLRRRIVATKLYAVAKNSIQFGLEQERKRNSGSQNPKPPTH